MKREQARFYHLTSALAAMGIGFTAPVGQPEWGKTRAVPGRKIFRPLSGWRHRKVKITEDNQRIQAAADRRIARAAKRHADYPKCLANNPCLGNGYYDIEEMPF